MRGFYRTEIGFTEKTIGGVIIGMLVAIGLGVAMKGARYDITRYTGDVASLETTREVIEGKAATLRMDGDLRGAELAGQAALATAAGAGELAALITGLTPLGPTEHYSADTLFEKINGRAPAYIEFNFVELTSRSFKVDVASGHYIDVFLFRHDSPLNAFGIFSLERGEATAPLDFASDGYWGEMGFYLRRGSTYVQVIASSPEAEVMGPAEAYTRALVETIPVDVSGLEGRQALPPENQIPGSLTYIAQNAYGQAVLNRIFEARYSVPEGELTFFAQATDSAETAEANWNALLEFNRKYSNVTEVDEGPDAKLFVSENFGEWSVLRVSGSTLMGVVNCADEAAARSFIARGLEASAASRVSSGFSTEAEALDSYYE